MSSLEDIFGEAIDTYTRAQAIEDGTLACMMQGELGEVSRQHYKCPVACSAGVHALIRQAVEHPDHCNDWPGIWHDVLYMSKHGARSGESMVLFKVTITGTGRKRYHNMILTVGPGDNAEPVITVMLQGED